MLLCNSVKAQSLSQLINLSKLLQKDISNAKKYTPINFEYKPTQNLVNYFSNKKVDYLGKSYSGDIISYFIDRKVIHFKTASNDKKIKIMEEIKNQSSYSRSGSGNLTMYTIEGIALIVVGGDIFSPYKEHFSIAYVGDSKSDNGISNSLPNNNEIVFAKTPSYNKLEITSNTTTTNINVKKGDRINLRAEGSIVLGAFAGRGGANGIDGFMGYNKVDGFRHGSLLGKIGNGPWFFVGTDASIVADRAGILTLIINDSATNDNEGSFIVEYGINKEVSKSATNYQPKQETSTANVTTKKETPPIKKENEILYQDDFSINKSNWSSSLKKHSFIISNNKMIYDNQEKVDELSYSLNTPIELNNDDNYMVEVDMQTLTPCENKEVFISFKNSGYNYFGFSVGSNESDVTFWWEVKFK